MIRKASLYFLFDKECKTLIDIVEQSQNKYLKLDITIYKLTSSSSGGNNFAILALSNEVEKIVLDYGAFLADETDTFRHTLKTYYGDPVYGSKSNVDYLKVF